MLGQLDLSLLPLDLLGSAEMAYGGQSGQWGSGAIGGVLHLGSENSFDEGFKADLTSSLGQFDRYRQSGQIGWSGQKFSTDTRIFHHSSINDYPFRIDDKASGVQSNAKVRMHGVMQSFGLRPTARDQLGMHYWYQKSHRQIPPTLRQTTSRASQDDETHRLALNFRHLRDRFILSANLGYFNESLRYNDPRVRIDSRSRFHSYSSDVGIEYWMAREWNLTAATTLNYVNAWIENYDGWRDQLRWSGFLR